MGNAHPPHPLQLASAKTQGVGGGSEDRDEFPPQAAGSETTNLYVEQGAIVPPILPKGRTKVVRWNSSKKFEDGWEGKLLESGW